MIKLEAFNSMFTVEEITGILDELHADLSNEIEFEDFLKVSSLCV
jgi:plastin-1